MKYEVCIREINYTPIAVEAENENSAKEIALDEYDPLGFTPDEVRVVYVDPDP